MSAPRPTLSRIFLVALKLGCTSFGGPIAHLAYFREEYVARLGWLDDEAYAELVALCQFLPGPASSQTGFGIGLMQRGLAGGLAAWLGFTLPSALLMIAFGYGISSLRGVAGSGWLHGLNLAAVAVVAQAVIAMWRRLCPDWPRSVLALVAVPILVYFTAGWVQLVVIAGGALAGWRWLRSGTASVAMSATSAQSGPGLPRWGSVSSLLLFFLPLILLPVWAQSQGDNGSIAIADKFYRAGALVFGGGHVILPLLQGATVTPGWIASEQFLAGYGAAQAVPGPLLTFAGYVGTVMRVGPGGWLGGVWALLWVFAPALLIVLGVLPWWRRLQANPSAQAALRGANAAVVGLLLAALLNPIATTALTGWKDAAVALGAFGLLHVPRVTPWMVVLACAGAGIIVL
jgi:chromate transporter